MVVIVDHRFDFLGGTRLNQLIAHNCTAQYASAMVEVLGVQQKYEYSHFPPEKVRYEILGHKKYE